MSASDLLYPNGLDGETGTYLHPPTSVEALADAIWKRQVPPDLPADDPTQDETYDPKRVALVGVDTKDLSQTGWGVMFPAGVDRKVKRALEPLLELRRRQVGRSDHYHELHLSPGQTAEYFLRKLQAGRATALRPERLPYYLLLVGGPREISYELQLKLGGSVAVGRIDFDPPDDYRAYAETVLACAEGRGRRPREVAFFGAYNAGDPTTYRTLNHLTEPLADRIEALQTRFGVRRVMGPEATKSHLADLYGGNDLPPPAVLFASDHGLAFESHLEHQLQRQGALLCSDFPGPFEEERPVPEDVYFQATDVTDDADFRGMVVMHFSCYGAGTPKWNSYARTAEARTLRADRPFVARLPRRLLSHRDGALAFLGHVDSSWTTSFSWPGETSQPLAFEEVLRLLLAGQPVGAALEPIRELWDYAARESTCLWQAKELDRPVSEERFVHFWRANNDAQGWVICGDPAVTVAARGIV